MIRTGIRRRGKKRAGASSSLIAQLDDAARTVCMLRAGAQRLDTGWWGACQKCEKDRYLQWSHYIGRRLRRTRWEEDNTFALCAGCHMGFDQKTSYLTMDEWVRNEIGEARYHRLRYRITETFKVDHKLTLVALKMRLKELEK